LCEIKIRDYTCGLIVTIVGLGLYSYYVRERLAALTLFSVAFFLLALVGLGALLVWCATVQVAVWARPASRSLIAFSRRSLAAYAGPGAINAFPNRLGDCSQVNRRDSPDRLGSVPGECWFHPGPDDAP
jgi:hypothetical protein